jgi:ABC-type glycerol-3-phosphate transport system substrate-binding protein
MKKLLALVVAIALLTGCSGMRKTGSTFTAHAEALRIFGFPIPEDDQAAAARMVPKGANINTVSSTPADWTSIWGVLSSIIGINFTEISGTMNN